MHFIQGKYFLSKVDKKLDIFGHKTDRIEPKMSVFEVDGFHKFCQFFKNKKSLLPFIYKQSLRKLKGYSGFGGQGWIRTIEDEVDGFTVRCIWPLCNLPIN